MNFSIRNFVISILNAFFEYKRFFLHSSFIFKSDKKNKLRGEIIFICHSIEKGLCLKTAKEGFGKDKVEIIIKKVSKYIECYGFDDFCEIVFSTLNSYRECDYRNKFCDKLIDDLLNAHDKNSYKEKSGFFVKKKEEIFCFEKIDAIRFISSRRSIRDYSGDLISREDLFSIISLAKLCPSVCNRQGARVYISNDKEKIKKILSFQNGNSGFGNEFGAVFIVVVDLGVFLNETEKNQGYIDGGIFALSIANSIHAHHFGGCMLNWSQSFRQDDRLRKFVGISDNEIIITMIGAGVLHNDYIKIAASPRYKVEDTISWVS